MAGNILRYGSTICVLWQAIPEKSYQQWLPEEEDDHFQFSGAKIRCINLMNKNCYKRMVQYISGYINYVSTNINDFKRAPDRY